MRILLLAIFTISSLFTIGQTSTCWNNSRGNAQLNGVSPVNFPQNVKLKWTFDADGIFKSAPVICDGKIVLGSTNGTLYCLNLKGDSIWGFKTDNGIEAPALIDNGVVYFGNLSGWLYAINLSTGSKIWEYKTDNQIMGAPTIFKEGTQTILAVGSYDYYLHGVDAKTGKGLWKYESDNFLNSAPALSNGTAVFGGCDGFLHSVNMKTGASEGKVEIATYIASSPAVEGSKAYVGDYDGGVSCIDLKNKKIQWKYTGEDGNQVFIASPALVGNKIFIGNRDKFLYCFDKNSGELLWKKNTGNRIEASAIANSRHVLTINMRGDVILFNINDGSVAWNYQLGVASINSPAIIENNIIIAGSDGNVYCLGN